MLDLLQHLTEPKYVFGTHKVVTKHDEIHFSVYFLQSFKQCISIAPMTFDAAKGVFANGLSAFIILRVLFDVLIIDIHCILVLTFAG